MDPKLLVRLYNVGMGDCIYLRVPVQGKEWHILIDCGNFDAKSGPTQRALEDLKRQLPQDETHGNKYRLDVLAISHPHKDHISGFNWQDWFEQIWVERLWLGSTLDSHNPRSKRARQIGEMALQGLQRLAEFQDSPLGQELGLSDIPAYQLAADEIKDDKLKEEILEFLRNKALKVYYLDDETVPDQENGLNLLQEADQPGTEQAHFHVLSPASNVDDTYLGKELAAALDQFQLLTTAPSQMNSLAALNQQEMDKLLKQQLNVSPGDFRRLYTRLACNAIAMALSKNALVNISGLVLLLEWKGRRLLFPGDAEWLESRQGIFTREKQNGCWNTILAKHPDLLQPLDFLKVGHHGSGNATPWSWAPKLVAVDQILNRLVPDPQDTAVKAEDRRRCQVVVSTERTTRFIDTIPLSNLLVELGQRAANSRSCYKEYAHYETVLQKRYVGSDKIKGYLKEFQERSVPEGALQPQRTDLYMQEPDCPEEAKFTDEYGIECAKYIDFCFPP
jgi:beta-lactamase superfamily II metal-dependent hydrolase